MPTFVDWKKANFYYLNSITCVQNSSFGGWMVKNWNGEIKGDRKEALNIIKC